MTPPTPTLFELDSPYRRLAHSLDELPNRFPPTDDESELRLLAKIFTPEEAGLAADLQPDVETTAEISERLGRSPQDLVPLLKEMARKGLITMGKTPTGRLGFGLMPFVVGIYEEQADRMDAEMARLFEDYFQKAFSEILKVKPQLHRVIPVGESIKNTMEVRPFESASSLVDQMQAWGVTKCICRAQKALIGQACGHPIEDICMVLSQKPDAFSGSAGIRALTKEEALQTLRRAAELGLVHCVSNNQHELWYICNCCTCSCGILRGMAELGIANVVAHSAFVNRVDEELCIGCGECLTACQFNALTLEDRAQVQEMRCVGCGVCVSHCPQGALGLERRPEAADPPVTEADWREERQASRLG